MIARPRVSSGDWVSVVPLCIYFGFNLRWPALPAQWEGILGALVALSISLSFGAIGYGTLLVVLDDLVAWRRSPEQGRWLLRAGIATLPVVLFICRVWVDD